MGAGRNSIAMFGLTIVMFINIIVNIDSANQIISE